MRRGRGGGDGATLPASRQTRRLVCRARGDEGFVLLESIVSISLITVIMAALTSLFVTVIRVDSEQRARQVAVQVADSAASMVRSLPTSDLLTGRTQALVDAQWSTANAPSDVLPYLAAMEKALPLTTGGTSVLPLALPPQVVHGVTYTVNVYLGWCHTATPEVLGVTACVASASSHDQLRAVFGVTWPDKHCALNTGIPTCAYVSATLLSTATDPVFNLNQPAPTSSEVQPPPLTGYAVGDTLPNLQMAVKSGTGVPSFTWELVSGSWPGGVSMAPSGLITGTLTTEGTVTLVVEVTDGFFRKVRSSPFTWTVLPRLVVTSPGAMNSVVAVAITDLSLVAAGGAGPAYKWSVDPAGPLPPGLNLSTAGVVSGTPSGTAPQPYTVVLTVADQSVTRTVKLTFVWTIRLPVTVANISARNNTVGHPNIFWGAPVAAGGTAPYTWTSTSLPAGLVMASDGSVSGTPTTVGVNTVTATATDQWGIQGRGTFTWTIFAAPNITTTAPGPATLGRPVSIQVASCPNTPCRWSMANLPPGLSIDAVTGVVSGRPSSVGTFTNITVSVTDADNVSASAGPFDWVVVMGPTVTSPPNLSSRIGSPVKIRLATTCPIGRCTYALLNGPPGVSVDDTGLLAGRIDLTAVVKTYTGVTVTVTDANGATATSAAFSWKVDPGARITATWPVVTTVGGTPDQPMFVDCPVSTTCTVSATGQPIGIGLTLGPGKVATNTTRSGTIVGPQTVYLSGLVDAATPLGTRTVTLTVSWSGNTGTLSDSGQWTVIGSPPTVASPGDLSSRVGSPVSIRLASTCPATPCSYTLVSGPGGVSIDGAGLMTGTVGGTAGTFTGVTVVTTDVNRGQATSAPFTWTVSAASTQAGFITATWGVVTSRGAQVEQPFIRTCPTTCTWTVTGNPAGTGITGTKGNFVPGQHLNTWSNQGAGTKTDYLSGTVDSTTPPGIYTVTLTITWPGGSDSDTGTWIVQ